MILNTARLTLKPQQQSDAPALFSILGDVEAMRFWSHPPIARLAVVEELVREQQAAQANGQCRYWTVQEDTDTIGSVDLSLIQNGSAELGFLFRRDRWGQGLAGEAVAAVIRYALGPMALNRLAAAIQADNHKAARVAEKSGFVAIDRRRAAIASGEIRDCVFYLLRRDQLMPAA